MNKKTILILSSVILIIIIVCFVIKNTQTNNDKIDESNISLPINYTLENYSVKEISNISCKKSTECVTPNKYLMQSNCPYTSLCINNKCNVVCPGIKNYNVVGGDRDEHGCIGSAGYSWCEIKNKCLRIWEEKCGTSSSITNQ